MCIRDRDGGVFRDGLRNALPRGDSLADFERTAHGRIVTVDGIELFPELFIGFDMLGREVGVICRVVFRFTIDEHIDQDPGMIGSVAAVAHGVSEKMCIRDRYGRFRRADTENHNAPSNRRFFQTRRGYAGLQRDARATRTRRGSRPPPSASPLHAGRRHSLRFSIPPVSDRVYGCLLYTSYPIQKQLIQSSDDIFVLADSSKFEKKALLKVEEMKKTYTYVTDSDLPEELLQLYRENDRIISVSFTHLDVYKRQVWTRTAVLVTEDPSAGAAEEDSGGVDAQPVTKRAASREAAVPERKRMKRLFMKKTPLNKMKYGNAVRRIWEKGGRFMPCLLYTSRCV